MSEPLADALRNIADRDWKTFGKEPDGTLWQWAEVDFVPTEKYERRCFGPLFHAHHGPLQGLAVGILEVSESAAGNEVGFNNEETTFLASFAIRMSRSKGACLPSEHLLQALLP